MHKYFVDAELNSMLGSTYESTDYIEVLLADISNM